MLLSDRGTGPRSSPAGSSSIRTSLRADPAASIDVRIDRYFRVFENHRYPHIDPAVEQPDLTRLVETEHDDPFVLHPGEFVLASTFEVITLPGDVAGGWKARARWAG